MENTLKYPIKYAVLEIKERGGWSVGYDDITQGFIPSKCYVIESKVVYHPDGSSSISHTVVFPFEDIELFKRRFFQGSDYIGKKTIPQYDASGNVYPARVVEELYETHAEAAAKAKEKNEDIKHNLLLEISMLKSTWQDEYESAKAECEKRLFFCNCFEKVVDKETLDLKVSNNGQEIETNNYIRVLKPHQNK